MHRDSFITHCDRNHEFCVAQSTEDQVSNKLKLNCIQQFERNISIPYTTIEWVAVDIEKPLITNETCFYNPEPYHLDIRPVLLDWMFELSQKLGYSLKSYNLAVYILDGLLSVYEISFTSIRIVTYMSVHLAAKFEERIDKLPSLASVVELFKGEFSLEKIINIETTILSIFGFSVNRKTVYVELEELIDHGVVFCTDNYFLSGQLALEKVIEQLRRYFDEIKDKLQLSYEIYIYHPKIVASAIVATCRKLCHLDPWPFPLKYITGLLIEDLTECMDFLEESQITEFSKDVFKPLKDDLGAVAIKRNENFKTIEVNSNGITYTTPQDHDNSLFY